MCTFFVYDQIMKKRTNMYFDEQDKAYIEVIKERYNLATDVAAVRLALKLIATQHSQKKDK